MPIQLSHCERNSVTATATQSAAKGKQEAGIKSGMKKINYTTVEELLIDDSFLVWFHQTDKTEVEKWNRWIEAGPEHQYLAEKAIHFLKLILLAREKDEVTEDQISSIFNRIVNTIVTYEKQQRNTSIK